MLDFNLTRFFRDQYLAEADINTQSIRTNNFEHDRIWKVLDRNYEMVQRKVSTKYTKDEYENLVEQFVQFLIKFDVSYNFSLMDSSEITDLFAEWIKENNLNNPSPNDPDDKELYEEDDETELLNDDVELKRKHDIKTADELEKEYDEVITEIANKIRQNYGK
jgi:hypothetical protein